MRAIRLFGLIPISLSPPHFSTRVKVPRLLTWHAEPQSFNIARGADVIQRLRPLRPNKKVRTLRGNVGASTIQYSCISLGDQSQMTIRSADFRVPLYSAQRAMASVRLLNASSQLVAFGMTEIRSAFRALRKALTSPAVLQGGKYNGMFPAISLNTARSLATTGSPLRSASTSGRPNPSMTEGITSAFDRAKP